MKIMSIRLFLFLLVAVTAVGCNQIGSGSLVKAAKQPEVAADTPEVVQKRFEQITASRLNLRESASARAKILAALKLGESVEILTEKAGWTKVRSKSGSIGWVASSYLTSFEREQSANKKPGVNRKTENVSVQTNPLFALEEDGEVESNDSLGKVHKETSKNDKIVEPKSKAFDFSRMDGTPGSGEASGKLVVDGKTVQITKASAISGPNTFHPERKTVFVVLSDEQLSSELINGAKSVSEIEKAAPQNSVILEIRPGSYAITVGHEILGDLRLMETMGGDSTGELKLEENRASGLIQTFGSGPITMLGHEVEYEIRFDSPILKDFPLVEKVETVLSDDAKKLPADGAEPGRAYLDACSAEDKERAEKKAAMKSPEALRKYMEEKGELPSTEALKESGKTLDEFLAMMIEMNAAMESLGGNEGDAPKTCEVLGGRSDGKVALLQTKETKDGKAFPKDVTLVRTENGWKVYSVVPGGGNQQPELFVTVNDKPVPMRVALAVGEGEDSVFIFSSVALTCDEMIGEIKTGGRSLHHDEVTFKLTRQPAPKGEGWRWSTYFDGSTRQAGNETKIKVGKIDLEAGSKIQGTLETTLRACCGDRADLLVAKGSFESIGCGSVMDASNKPGANIKTESVSVQKKPVVALKEDEEYESTDSSGKGHKETSQNDKLVEQKTKVADFTGMELGAPGSGKVNFGAIPDGTGKVTEKFVCKVYRSEWKEKSAESGPEPVAPFKNGDVIKFSVTYDKSSKKIKGYNTGPDGIIQWGEGDDKTVTLESRQLNTGRSGKHPFLYFSNVRIEFDPKTQAYFTQQEPCVNQDYLAFIRSYAGGSADLSYQICDNIFSFDLFPVHGNMKIKTKEGTWLGGLIK